MNLDKKFCCWRSRSFWCIVAAAIVVRMICHWTYLPWWCGDSGGYSSPAALLMTNRIGFYDGARTPGYPILVGLVELVLDHNETDPLSPGSAMGVVFIQSILGVAACALFYLILLRVGITPVRAFWAGLFFAILMPPGVFEMTILTESFSLFFNMLTLYLAVLSLSSIREGKPFRWKALLFGLAAGWTTLIRPNNLVMVVVFLGGIFLVALWRWWGNQKNFARSLFQLSGLASLGLALLLAIWMTFNYLNTGVLTLSQMTWVVRTSPAYNLFGRVQEKDRVLGEIMNKYYLQTNHGNTVKRDYIWLAFPEIGVHEAAMPIAPHGSYCEASYVEQYIGNVSSDLLRRYPLEWLQNGLSDYRDTFDFQTDSASPLPQQDPRPLEGTSVVKSVAGWKLIGFVLQVEKIPILLCYLMTYVAVLLAGWQLIKARNESETIDALTPCLVALASLAAMIAPCFLAAYYARYAIPFYAFFILGTVYVISRLAGFIPTWFSRRPSSAPKISTR